MGPGFLIEKRGRASIGYRQRVLAFSSHLACILALQHPPPSEGPNPWNPPVFGQQDSQPHTTTNAKAESARAALFRSHPPFPPSWVLGATRASLVLPSSPVDGSSSFSRAGGKGVRDSTLWGWLGWYDSSQTRPHDDVKRTKQGERPKRRPALPWAHGGLTDPSQNPIVFALLALTSLRPHIWAPYAAKRGGGTPHTLRAPLCARAHSGQAPALRGLGAKSGSPVWLVRDVSIYRSAVSRRQVPVLLRPAKDADPGTVWTRQPSLPGGLETRGRPPPLGV